jgi:hypothetical protein
LKPEDKKTNPEWCKGAKPIARIEFKANWIKIWREMMEINKEN